MSKPHSKLFLLFFAIFITLSGCKDQETEVPVSESNLRYIIKNGSEFPLKVIRTSFGGFAYAGQAGDEAFILVTDAKGNEIWYKTFGGESRDAFNDITEARNGDFIAVGKTSSVSLGSKNANSDGFAVRVSSGGQTIWSKGFNSDDTRQFLTVREDPDGNIIAAGLNAPGSSNTWYVKTDASGNTIYERQYEIGPWHDMVRAITFTSDGDYVLWGWSSPSGIVTEIRKYSVYRFVVRKSTGTQLQPLIVYDEIIRDETIRAIAEHAFVALEVGSDVIWANNMTEIDKTAFVQLTKVDQNGNIIFQKKVNSGENTLFKNITKDNAGGFLISGGSDYESSAIYSQSTITKVDDSGNKVWKRSYGSSDGFQYTHCCYPDGDHIIFAGIMNNIQIGRAKFLFFTTNKNGEITE